MRCIALYRWLLASTLILIFASGTAFAADAENGEVLAKEHCSRCHDIGPNGAFKQHPPSFAAIAVYRSAQQIYGRIIFPPVHTYMPQIGLISAPGQIDDIVAYIGSLEAP